MGKEYTIRYIYNAGLSISYDVNGTSFYSTTSLIELFLYSTGSVAYYRILATPNKNIIIRYLGNNDCDFKLNGNILYVLPRHTDITIKYKIGLYRMIFPILPLYPFLILRILQVILLHLQPGSTDLGGLIGINDTWLRGMGDKIESIDKLTSGIYSIGEVLNIDGFNDYGLLVVFNSLLYKVQIIFGRYNGKIAYRFMISSDWDNWNVV